MYPDYRMTKQNKWIGSFSSHEHVILPWWSYVKGRIEIEADELAKLTKDYPVQCTISYTGFYRYGEVSTGILEVRDYTSDKQIFVCSVDKVWKFQFIKDEETETEIKGTYYCIQGVGYDGLNRPEHGTFALYKV